jgi:hypothetical protein
VTNLNVRSVRGVWYKPGMTNARDPEPSFALLVSNAVGLALVRPDQTRALLHLLEPFEGHRLWLELLRVARGRLAPRRMSHGLRDVLPFLLEYAREPAPAADAAAPPPAPQAG